MSIPPHTANAGDPLDGVAAFYGKTSYSFLYSFTEYFRLYSDALFTSHVQNASTMGTPLPPGVSAQHATAGNPPPFQFVSPSSLTLNSMSSVQSTSSASASRFTTGVQWLAANHEHIIAALQNITDGARLPTLAVISDGTFDHRFPTWAPLRPFLAHLGASIILFNPALLNRDHIWDAELLVAAANDAINLAMSVVSWDLDPGKRRIQISYLIQC